MEGFKYVRLYSTPDGESHFEDVEIAYPDARRMSAPMPLSAWSVRTTQKPLKARSSTIEVRTFREDASANSARLTMMLLQFGSCDVSDYPS